MACTKVLSQCVVGEVEIQSGHSVPDLETEYSEALLKLLKAVVAGEKM
jgi:hypothetical protein